MRVKSRYSLNLEELGVPAPDLMPVVLESGISLPQVQESFSESLNVFKAFANYLVERNRTRDMARQFAAARRALDARNYEAERQSEIIVANYAEQLKHFLAEQEAEMRLLTEKIELEGRAIAEQIRDERAQQHEELELTRQILNRHLKLISRMQEFLSEAESSPESYVRKNRQYFRVVEECRAKMRAVQNRLNDLDKPRN